jgi:PBP1b-binding outer membrane lipoprotein LpoB
LPHPNKALVRIIALVSTVALTLSACSTLDRPATEVNAVNATPTEFEATIPPIDTAAPTKTETATFALG